MEHHPRPQVEFTGPRDVQSLIDRTIQQLQHSQRTFQQENRWLQQEVQELRTLLAALVDEAGGSVSVSLRTLQALRHPTREVQLEVREDVEHRQLQVRVYPVLSAVQPK